MFWEHTVGYSPPKKARKQEERVEKYINISRVAGQCRSSVINDDVAIPTCIHICLCRCIYIGAHQVAQCRKIFNHRYIHVYIYASLQMWRCMYVCMLKYMHMYIHVHISNINSDKNQMHRLFKLWMLYTYIYSNLESWKLVYMTIRRWTCAQGGEDS